MKILVACEYSGVVRDAFAAKGHNVWSCDLLPSDRPGRHIQGDVLMVLNDGWDMMIAHPPCTHLAVSGARYFSRKQAEQAEALAFVSALMFAPIPSVAVENPVGIISTWIRKPDQIIQPYEYGDNASKKTCLWLKGLPLLNPTCIVQPNYICTGCGARFGYALGKYGCPTCQGTAPALFRFDNQTVSGQNRLPPSATRAHERSKTYEGIGKAMADQWGAVP